MRVAVLSDIHGNLPALEAVLEDVRHAGPDRVVIGGDVLPGPMPRECLDALLALDIPVQFIHGNGDRESLAHLSGREMTTVPEPFRGPVIWAAEQLGQKYRPILASWPLSLSVDIPPLGVVFFCHSTPRNDVEIFTRLTPEEALKPLFEGLGAGVVVCGHTHMQFDRMVGSVRVVNAGSVGMPFGEPRANWLMLGPDVELRHTNYDLAAAADRIRATQYPEANEFAATYVLKPPTEADMLERFTPFSLK
jgi:predicted phosphodiesterase